MKNLAKEDVKDAAVKLMQSNGSTTTLDVKNELRTLGFWATQGIVSDLMNEVSDDEGWTFDNTSGYRVYRVKAVATTDSNDSNDSQDDGSVSDDGKYMSRNGKKIEAIDAKDIKSDDWECYSQVAGIPTQYFPGEFSRDEVRCAFRFYAGLHFNDTRAKRLV